MRSPAAPLAKNRIRVQPKGAANRVCATRVRPQREYPRPELKEMRVTAPGRPVLSPTEAEPLDLFTLQRDCPPLCRSAAVEPLASRSLNGRSQRMANRRMVGNPSAE
jgi:hypothetical protein